MRQVILRDDDTNAFTPPECLERLYRPFLDRGLPVNLAVIPAVQVDAKRPDGKPEGFLNPKSNAARSADIPVGSSQAHNNRFHPLTADSPLARYLRANPGYHLVQHGLHHEPFEFDRTDRAEVAQRLASGRRILQDAGFPAPQTFVAPHDKFSRASYSAVAREFSVISTGWFELRRLPHSWWPQYVLAKSLRRPHWRVNGAMLLSHPGCLLSCYRPYDSMLDTIKAHLQRQSLTVLVTHWWEYFRDGHPDDPFISVLHSLADYLSTTPDLRVLTFAQVAKE